MDNNSTLFRALKAWMRVSRKRQVKELCCIIIFRTLKFVLIIQKLPAKMVDFMSILSSSAFVGKCLIDNNLNTSVSISIFPTHYTNSVQLSHLELKIFIKYYQLYSHYLIYSHRQRNTAIDKKWIKASSNFLTIQLESSFLLLGPGHMAALFNTFEL